VSEEDKDDDVLAYYKQYPPNFFDLVVIDECHRGSANDESSWRDILNHFGSAIHLGLTATPKRRGLNEFLLKNSVGEVIYEADAEVLTPKIQIKVISQNEIEFNEKEMNVLNAKKSVVYINGKKTTYRIDRFLNIADSKNISKYMAQIIIKAPKIFSKLAKVELKTNN